MAKANQNRIPMILLLLATGVVATTCIRIEILNTRGGGILPNQPAPGTDRVVRWRWHSWTNEARWREQFGPRNQDGRPLSRELTKEDARTMNRMIAEAQASNDLKSVIESWGLLQYLLVPVTFIGSMAMLFSPAVRKSRRSIAAGCLLASIVAGVLMAHREYFQSLGW